MFALSLFVPFWVTEYLIQLRQPPLPVPEPQPGLSGPFTIPALTFHNYFISLIFPMAGSAPGGPHSSPSSIRQSLTPSALLSPPILIFAGSLTVSPLLSLIYTHKHTHTHTYNSMGNASTIWRETKANCNFPHLEKKGMKGWQKKKEYEGERRTTKLQNFK